MRLRIKSILASTLLTVFVVLATLFALEFMLRIVAERLPTKVLLYFHQDLKNSLPSIKAKIEDSNPWTTVRVEDPDLGWTYQPDLLVEGTNEDGEAYHIKASPEGFYTPDQPDKNIPQFVVLGDSFLSTIYVRKPIAWVLREELDLPVYNLSVGGWGPQNYQAAYNKFANQRYSKLVVVFSFVNDITDVNNWNRWQASEQLTSFAKWLQENDSSVANTDTHWLDRHSILWNLTKLAIRNVRSAEYDLTRVVKDKAEIGEYFRASMADEGFRLQFVKGQQFMIMDPEAFSPGGPYAPYMEAYFQSLDRLRSDIEAHGSEMLLIWIPSKERVYLPLLTEDIFRQYVTNPSGKIDGLEHALYHYAEVRDIHFLDLTPELVNRAREGQKLYFTVDGHLNSLGNQVVGELVATAIRDLLAEMDSQ